MTRVEQRLAAVNVAVALVALFGGVLTGLFQALEYAGVGRNLEVARHARLALAEDVGQLADGQLHDPQQGEDAQPRRVGQGREGFDMHIYAYV